MIQFFIISINSSGFIWGNQPFYPLAVWVCMMFYRIKLSEYSQYYKLLAGSMV